MSDEFTLNPGNYVPSDKPETKERLLLPEGVYFLEIGDVDLKTSKAGNPYLNIKYRVCWTPTGKWVGKFVWDNLTLTAKTVKIVDAFLYACEIDENNISPMEYPWKENLLNAMVKAKVFTEDNPGYGKQNRVRFPERPTEAEYAAVEESDKTGVYPEQVDKDDIPF